MNVYLIVLFIVLVIMIGIFGFQIFKNYKNLKYKYEKCWPVQHRLDKDGNLQYSVDGKLWTDIIIYPYNECIESNLIFLKPKNNDEFELYKTKLNTMQKCHVWNTKQLLLYKTVQILNNVK